MRFTPNRYEEARVNARKHIRAFLYQKTPIAADIAEAIADDVATIGMKILSLGMEETKMATLSTIEKIQVIECVKNILQSRHDATFNAEHINDSNNAEFWKKETLRSAETLNGYIEQLGKLLGIDEMIDLLI